VNPDPVARPTLDEVRRYHLNRLNDALRAPGMWGHETTIRLFMDDMAFVDGVAETWRQEQQALRDRGAFNALGVRGVVVDLMPRYRDGGSTVASVYAEIAWRHDWLTVDRTLSDRDLAAIRDDPASWCARDRNLDDVLSNLGPPSVRIGGSNRRYSKTLAYATADRTQHLVCLHFAGLYDWDAPAPQPERAPVLVALRLGDGTFRESFTFTPAGAAYRERTGDADGADPTTAG
jgi:hypothetical protein